MINFDFSLPLRFCSGQAVKVRLENRLRLLVGIGL